jgi:hypothetical protein
LLFLLEVQHEHQAVPTAVFGGLSEGEKFGAKQQLAKKNRK